MEYQYHLAKWNERTDKRMRCPECKKVGYKEYVDAYGHPVDPKGHLCGKCDHENSCGYHLTPAEWFKANPEERKALVAEKVAERVQRKRIEIPLQKVGATMRSYDKNVFVKWLMSLPWDDDQRAALPELLKLYCIGTSKDGGCIWWQIDGNHVCRTGKKMLYKTDGHRLKDDEGNSIGFNWIHAMERQRGLYPEKEYDLVQCLFGEHLISAIPDASIHVVESEKSALIMSIVDPLAMEKHVWVACGGKNLLRLILQAPTGKRAITIYPDKDAFDEWVKDIKQLGIKCTVSDAVKRTSIAEDGHKCDIADIALRRMNETPERVLEEMKKNNPILTSFINTLELELTK
jgi:hypothetical protein